MLRVPSRRKKRHNVKRPNLIPILDAVFIFIFFLLMSANFIKIYEISSDVPIISSEEPPKNKKPPLALTLKITPQRITISTGVPSRVRKVIKKTNDGFYDLEKLHSYLVDLKKSNLKEKTAIFEPVTNLSYEDLVKIMDTVRLLRNTDPSYYVKDKDGVDTKVNELFDNIVFANIRS